MCSAPPKAEMTTRKTFGESMEMVGRNAPAITIIMTTVGVASFVVRLVSHQEAKIEKLEALTNEKHDSLEALTNEKHDSLEALTNEKLVSLSRENDSLEALTNEKLVSLSRENDSLRREHESYRRETDSKINESRAAAEKLAIEYHLKYKHSEEYSSLRKQE
jgi:peptidoglycan hydrolase CwlO-like protein